MSHADFIKVVNCLTAPRQLTLLRALKRKPLTSLEVDHIDDKAKSLLRYLTDLGVIFYEAPFHRLVTPHPIFDLLELYDACVDRDIANQ